MNNGDAKVSNLEGFQYFYLLQPRSPGAFEATLRQQNWGITLFKTVV